MPNRSRAARTTGCAVALLAAPLATAGERFETAVDLALATDFVFRGVSQTMSSAAAQAGVTVSHESGLFAYLWGSNVDYAADGGQDDGARAEVDLAAGYSRALSERVHATATWVRYAFPGMHEGFDYDYDELIATFDIDERHTLEIAYTDSVFGTGSPAYYAALSSSVELGDDLTLTGILGHYDLDDAYGRSYGHGSLALSGRFGEVDWSLDCHATDARARELFGRSSADSRIVLTLGLSF